MFLTFLENPKLLRHVLEDLPVGIYIVDGDRRIRFWNRAAEQLTGRLAHEVVGHLLEDAIQACDRRGNSLNGENCPVAKTLHQRKAQQCVASYLHKNGHRTAVRIRTRPILEYGDTVSGVTVLFDEAFASRDESPAPPMFGCLDPNTGIASHRLTRSVVNECLAGIEAANAAFGLLRIRILHLDEFRSKHGPQSVVPFLRAAAKTLRSNLDAESFLGCWEENEFLAVLTTASPMMVAMKADILLKLLSQSEVFWWGDRFLVEAEVGYTVATAGGSLDLLLQEMKLAHSSAAVKAAVAGANSTRSQG